MNDTPTRWVDTHCHIYDEKMDGDDTAAVSHARAGGVGSIIVIGTDADTSRRAIDIAARHDHVWATVGLHPHDAKLGVSSLHGLFDAPRVVGVGECGLDYFYDHSPRDTQRRAFAEQIAIAHTRSLPLVIHTRDAWDDTFAILDSEGVPERTVFHCFSGGVPEAERCIERGAFLSFSGIVTFPKAPEVREAAAYCPADRLLLETDAPYLAPVPHRGRPNAPVHVAVVGAAVAELRGIAVEDCARITTHNASIAFPGIAA